MNWFTVEVMSANAEEYFGTREHLRRKKFNKIENHNNIIENKGKRMCGNYWKGHFEWVH